MTMENWFTYLIWKFLLMGINSKMNWKNKLKETLAILSLMYIKIFKLIESINYIQSRTTESIWMQFYEVIVPRVLCNPYYGNGAFPHLQMEFCLIVIELNSICKWSKCPITVMGVAEHYGQRRQSTFWLILCAITVKVRWDYC